MGDGRKLEENFINTAIVAADDKQKYLKFNEEELNWICDAKIGLEHIHHMTKIGMFEYYINGVVIQC